MLENIVSDVRFELEFKNFRRRGHRAYPIAHTGLRNCGCIYRYDLRSETGILIRAKDQITTLAKVVEFLRNMFITAVTPRVYPFGHPGAKELCVF